MGDTKLKSVKQEKDFGVLITRDLKPARQCQEAYAKASRALGLIARTITYKSPIVMLQLYKTLVRPHLEYFVSAWSPYYEKDKALLESFQHRFTRMIPGFKELSYESRLLRLQLWTLEERQHRANLLEVFKMYSGSTLVSFHQFFKIVITNAGPSRYSIFEVRSDIAVPAFILS